MPPKLTRLPPEPDHPASWLLEVGGEADEDPAHDALAALLPPDGPVRAALDLDPTGSLSRIELELCENCPVMKWRSAGPGVVRISLSKVTAKAWAELWKLTAQGAGEYSFELLDFTAGAGEPVATYLTLRLPVSD